MTWPAPKSGQLWKGRRCQTFAPGVEAMRDCLKTISIVILMFVGLTPQIAFAQSQIVSEHQIILCLLPLEHADAEELAGVLKPFLSSSGTITPYPQTNTLIIKDKKSIVKQLVKVVKSSEDLRVCQNVQETPEN